LRRDQKGKTARDFAAGMREDGGRETHSMGIAMQRQEITVRGLVQGVGFRPFVHGLASRLGLGGFVRNRAGSVQIEIEGDAGSLERFVDELRTHPPSLSQIVDLDLQSRPSRGDRAFRIERSNGDASPGVFVSPDVATCAECLAELFDPANRRYRYPFINCSNCGPRYTIIDCVPYDRERTAMAGFAMCPACRAEYDSPQDRRFHTQATSCPNCGPRLEALQPDGAPLATGNPLAAFVDVVLSGGIGALKGLGGFHLVCNARDERAVAELRRRKQRDEKPFAVMVRDVAAARRLCAVDPREAELLVSPRRPIVLLRRCEGEGSEDGGWRMEDSGHACHPPSSILHPHVNRRASGSIASGVAPGNPYMGVMLPYTALHSLLMEAVGDVPLVMTSGNRAEEPIAFRDEEAVERLGTVADVILTHDRPIRVRSDDSVTRIVHVAEAASFRADASSVVHVAEAASFRAGRSGTEAGSFGYAGGELPVRRSRGDVPAAIPLPFAAARRILAVGGQLKGVFGLARDGDAFLSHHLGDLDDFRAYREFERDVAHFEQLFGIRPAVIAHDLHPDYASTGYAMRRAAECGLERLAVQHHHAHMASCMAENRLDGPAIGVSFDGTGYGTDGAIWGGEFLVGDYSGFERAAHLRYVRLPGGDKAIREPWRVAVAHLLDAGCDAAAVSDIPGILGNPRDVRTVERMIERGLNAPLTSSAGRLFDAVAAIAGVRSRVSHEGQAAMQLEWLATDIPEEGDYPFELSREESRKSESRTELQTFDLRPSDFRLEGGRRKVDHPSPINHQPSIAPLLTTHHSPLSIDTRPLIRAVARDVRSSVRPAVIARRFHSTIVEMIAAVCDRIREESQLERVVLSGGVFLNVILTTEVVARLASDGFRVYRHRLVPPNDGGLCLGQLAIAAKTAQRAAFDSTPAERRLGAAQPI
jgi:hydrogenase maturation protein HypF